LIKTITGGNPEGLLRTRPVSVALTHTGEGVYVGHLKDETKVAGIYNVSVSYNHEGTDRTHTRPVVLKPGAIEQSRSRAEIVEIKTAEGASQWLLRLYPVDRHGNAVLDTALLKQVEVSIDGGRVDKTPEIAFDSAFQQVVVAEPGRVPQLSSAAIGGKPLKIVGDDKPGTGFDAKLVILVLIVVGLALLIWFWGRQRPSA